MKRKLRIALVAATVAALGLFSGPAAGANEVLLIDSSSGTTASGGVQSFCTAVIGVATDLNHVTYTIEANSTATTNDPLVQAVGTSVRCEIVDSSGRTYGGASGGLPGPASVAVGTATVPRSAPFVFARVCGAAVFSNGDSVNTC